MEKSQTKSCEIHEMMWCAICNGDAKKFEQDMSVGPIFKGLQKESKR